MIEPVSGPSEAPAPSTISPMQTASASTAASISQTLAAEKALTVFNGAKEAAARHTNETVSLPNRSAMSHARSLEAIDDAVVRNLLDSLSPASRVAGSFFLADGDEPAPKSLIATYYEDV